MRPKLYEGLTSTQWAEKLGVYLGTFKSRIQRRGWAEAVAMGATNIKGTWSRATRVTAAELSASNGPALNNSWGAKTRTNGGNSYKDDLTPVVAPVASIAKQRVSEIIGYQEDVFEGSLVKPTTAKFNRVAMIGLQRGLIQCSAKGARAIMQQCEGCSISRCGVRA